MQDDEDDEVIQEFTALRLGMVIERDAAGRIVSAYVPNPFIIDQLLEQDIIDRDQHRYAIHFVAMRKVFLRGVATLKTVAMYQSPDTEPVTPPRFPIEDNDYLKVLRLIRHAPHRDVITEAVDDYADATTLYHLIAMRARVRDAFRALTVAVQQLWDQKEAAIEAEQKVLALDEKLCQSEKS
jgi:hypothetical protein